MTDPKLRAVIDAISDGRFTAGNGTRFRPLVDNLLEHDHFFVLEDFSAYRACQQHVDHTWKDFSRWTRASIINTARCGWFSSDRAIKEYCERIWQVTPVPIKQDTVSS
jgi:starch phosphorylase